MLFDKFVDATKSWWTDYFRFIESLQRAGGLDSGGGTLLYPNIILVTNCSGYYVAELIGANERFFGLSAKIHKEKSIYRYLSQFDDSKPDPIFHFEGGSPGLRSLCLAHDADFDELLERFPHVNMYQSRIKRVGGSGSTLTFGEDLVSCYIEDSVLVNRKESIFRCKSILSVLIVKSNIGAHQLSDLFAEMKRGGRVTGVHTALEHQQRLVVAGQLQSMILFPSLRETTIGEFLNLHPEVLKLAFKTDHFEYEPYLEWLEHDGTCEDTAINPDLMVKRGDGFFDIYDLKTAVLDRRNITKAERKRRRFIDYVEDGISQLANYREYFEYPENARYAKEKYGIVVNEPRLVLVVGSWENVNLDEVNQACRKYKDIDVIDYDTVCQMFIGAQTAAT